MMKTTCETCDYLLKSTDGKGYCVRFPRWYFVWEIDKHYCGEHSEVKKDG